MNRIKWLTPCIALIAVLCCSCFAFASTGATHAARLTHVSSDETDLPPDPSAYCIENPPFQQQQVDVGWQVQFENVIGDPLQNDWKCQYMVLSYVPIAAGEDGGEFPIGPINYTTPIDWNAMCNQQYPGASATWIPGPETGVDGAPWGCVGAPGVMYDPAEQSDGTHLIVSGG
jgi:hypothetical protein